VRSRVKQYLVMTLGGILCAMSINMFLVPHHFLSGGVSGLAIISYYLFGLPIGLQIFLMNLPLIYAAYRFIGKEYTVITVCGTVLFSLVVDATRFMADLNVLDDPLLAAIAGGLMSGVGSGLVFRVGGNLGGLDVVAAIVKKYYSFNIGFVGFSVNVVIMLLAATIFGLKLALLTLLSMFVSANVIDKVIEGFNRRKTIIIISDKGEKIAEAIISEVGRGVTFLHGEGAFTRQNKEVIFVVVSLTQIAKIKMLVHDVDSHAFMIVQDAYEVMGRGFTY
jgi:uncharacterized membrane-anchored protein YitT (DUF2179 family)